MPVTKASLIQPAIDSLNEENRQLQTRVEANLPTTMHRKERREQIAKLEELIADPDIGDRAKAALSPALKGFQAAEESNDKELHAAEAKSAELRETIKELIELRERHLK